MGNTFVQEVDNIVFSGSSIAVTLPSAGAGNAYVFGLFWAQAPPVTLSSVADDKGNTVALVGAALSEGNNGAQTGYAKNLAAGSTVITATFSGAIAEAKIWVHEVSGANTTAPLGQNNSAVDSFRNATCTDCVASPSVTTATNGEYVAGFCMSSSSPALDAGTGFTDPNPTNDSRGTSEYQVQGAAGSIAATFSRTDVTGATAMVFVVTLIAAGGAAAARVPQSRPFPYKPGSPRGLR